MVDLSATTHVERKANEGFAAKAACISHIYLIITLFIFVVEKGAVTLKDEGHADGEQVRQVVAARVRGRLGEGREGRKVGHNVVFEGRERVEYQG